MIPLRIVLPLVQVQRGSNHVASTDAIRATAQAVSVVLGIDQRVAAYHVAVRTMDSRGAYQLVQPAVRKPLPFSWKSGYHGVWALTKLVTSTSAACSVWSLTVEIIVVVNWKSGRREYLICTSSKEQVLQQQERTGVGTTF